MNKNLTLGFCTAAICLIVIIVFHAQSLPMAPADGGTLSFLPAVLDQGTPTPTPTATATATPTSLPDTATPPATNTTEPMPGQNVQCQASGSAQICTSVSDANPARYTTVTVYGRLIVSGAGQAGQSMSTTWHYKTSTPGCTGTTDAGGLAQCSRYISGATAGYQVNVDVSISGYGATTWFTPQ
jgi:hypothetical protein